MGYEQVFPPLTGSCFRLGAHTAKALTGVFHVCQVISLSDDDSIVVMLTLGLECLDLHLCTPLRSY